MPSEEELTQELAKQNREALPVTTNTITADEANIEFSFTDFEAKVLLLFWFIVV